MAAAREVRERSEVLASKPDSAILGVPGAGSVLGEGGREGERGERGEEELDGTGASLSKILMGRVVEGGGMTSLM